MGLQSNIKGIMIKNNQVVNFNFTLLHLIFFKMETYGSYTLHDNIFFCSAYRGVVNMLRI